MTLSALINAKSPHVRFALAGLIVPAAVLLRLGETVVHVKEEKEEHLLQERSGPILSHWVL